MKENKTYTETQSHGGYMKTENIDTDKSAFNYWQLAFKI